MRSCLRSVWLAGILVVTGLAAGFAAEPPAAKTGAEGLAGTWWEDTPDGGYFVSFLPQGEFRFYLASRSGPFELPPDLLSHGRWRVQGDNVVLTGMTHEKSTEGPTQSVGRLQLSGDSVVLTDVATGETMRGRRGTWSPDPIPPGTVRRAYYETMAGAGRLELVPEKREGSPGERIAVKVSLTNTGTQPMFVPLRLADRVELWEDVIPDPTDTTLRFHLDRGAGPAVPPRLLSVPLSPRGTVTFVATLVVPGRAGRLRLTAIVPENPRVTPAEVEFRVLPAAGP
jgi:hypothetical protein